MTRFENDPGSEHPMMEDLKPGDYAWCQCGKTKTVPFCDGSHEGSGIEPLPFTVPDTGASPICNCGLTNDPPYCDGSHAEI